MDAPLTGFVLFFPKDMPKKFDAAVLASCVANSTECTLRTLVDSAIKSSTCKQYASRVQNFEAFCQHRGTGLTKQSFIDLLGAMQQQGFIATTASGYRSALLHHQTSLGLERWAGEPEIIKACQGFAYAGGRVDKLRGAIDQELIGPLLEWLTDRRMLMLAIFVHILFGAALRGSELIQLEAKHVDPAKKREDGSWGMMISLPDKRYKATNCHTAKPRYWKSVPDEETSDLIIEVCRLHPIGLLFPVGCGFKVAEARKVLQAASVELGFPSELKWDGLHGLRHGGTQFLLEAFPNDKQAVIMSSSSKKRYGESNEHRIKRGTKMAEKRKRAKKVTKKKK